MTTVRPRRPGLQSKWKGVVDSLEAIIPIYEKGSSRISLFADKAMRSEVASFAVEAREGSARPRPGVGSRDALEGGRAGRRGPRPRRRVPKDARQGAGVRPGPVRLRVSCPSGPGVVRRCGRRVLPEGRPGPRDRARARYGRPCVRREVRVLRPRETRVEAQGRPRRRLHLRRASADRVS